MVAKLGALLIIQPKKVIKIFIYSMTQAQSRRDQGQQQTCWCLYLQIILPQVFVFLTIFVLIQDGRDFWPLCFWIWLVQFEAPIKGAGGGGLQADSYCEWSCHTPVSNSREILRKHDSTMGLKQLTWPEYIDAPLLPSSREALEWK